MRRKEGRTQQTASTLRQTEGEPHPAPPLSDLPFSTAFVSLEYVGLLFLAADVSGRRQGHEREKGEEEKGAHTQHHVSSSHLIPPSFFSFSQKEGDDMKKMGVR